MEIVVFLKKNFLCIRASKHLTLFETMPVNKFGTFYQRFVRLNMSKKPNIFIGFTYFFTELYISS